MFQETNLIPDETLAYGIFRVQEMKDSQSGGKYLIGVVTLEAPGYKGLQVSSNIMHPFFEGNSAKARQMGETQLRNVAEAVGLFVPGDASSYSQFSTFESFLAALEGKRVPVEVYIEDARDQHPPQNRFRFLTPNPTRGRAHRNWLTLTGKGGEENATNSTVGQPVSQGAVQGDQEDKESGDNKAPW